MNSKKIGSKVLGALAVLATLVTLSGCTVYARPAGRAVYVEPQRTVYVRR